MLNCKLSKQNKMELIGSLILNIQKEMALETAERLMCIRIHMVKRAIKQNAVWTGLHVL